MSETNGIKPAKGHQKPPSPAKKRFRTHVQLLTAITLITLIATTAATTNAASMSFLDSVKSFFGIEISQTAPAATMSPNLGSIGISPLNQGLNVPGGSATYIVTVNSLGGSGAFTANLSAAILPSNVSAMFSPATLSFTGGAASQMSTLTLTGTTAAINGPHSIVIQAVDSGNPGDLVDTSALGATVTITNGCDIPVVTSDPSNVTVTYDNNAVFTAAATGTAPAVQWEEKIGAAPFTAMFGETNLTLTLVNPPVSYTGRQYRAVFTNSCGTDTTTEATLTVNPGTPTATIDNTPATYNGTPQTATVSCLGGGAATLATGGTGTNAGSYTATVNCAASANYNAESGLVPLNDPFVVNKIAPTAWITNSPSLVTGSEQTAQVACLGGGAASINSGGVGTIVGTYATTVACAASTNYNATTVSAGNFAIVDPNVILEQPSTLNWFYYDDVAPESFLTSLEDFVGSPVAPTLGPGSARIMAAASPLPQSKLTLGTTLLNGVRFKDITTLTYETYLVSGTMPPRLQFNADFDTNDAPNWQGRVEFVVPNPDATGTWVTRDVLAGNLKFSYGGHVSGNPWLVGANPCPISGAGCSVAFVRENYPNLRISVKLPDNSPGDPFGALLFRVEPSHDTRVDNVVIGINGDSPVLPNTYRTFNFEQASSSVTVNCPAGPFTYTGGPIVPPCTASYLTSPDGETGSAAVSYTNNTAAGTATATGTYLGDDNHAGSTGTANFTILKADPIVTFGAPPTPTYLGGNFPVTATTTNTDLTTVLFSVSSGPCAIVSQTGNSATLSSSGAGTCVVQAAGAETANFNATSATQNVTIAKATPSATLAITNSPTAEDGNPHMPNVVVSSSTTPGTVVVTTPGLPGPITGTTAVFGTFVPDDAVNYNSVTGVSAGDFVIVAATPVIVQPGNSSWGNWDDDLNVPAAVQDDFVAGPEDPAAGDGSARLQGSTPSVKLALASQLYLGTRVADITSLGYDTYLQTGSVPYLQFDVDFDGPLAGSGGFQGRAMFLPTVGIASGEWQRWNALSDQGRWAFSGAPGDAICPIQAPPGPVCTLQDALTAYPEMSIRLGATSFGLLFRTDPGSLAYVDRLVVGVNANSPTFPSTVRMFDFEQGTSQTFVTCSVPSVAYNGGPHNICSAYYTRSDDGFVTQYPTGVTYTPDNINAGTVTASASFSNDNFSLSSDSETFEITPIAPTCNIVGYSGMYDGLPHGASGTCDVAGTYNYGSTFTDFPGGTANWTFDPTSDNYTNASGSVAITIAKAPSTVNITCPASVTYNATAQEPCDYTVTLPGDPAIGPLDVPTGGYTNNTNPGTATAYFEYAGDLNHTADDDTETFLIDFCPTLSIPNLTSATEVDKAIPVNATDLTPGSVQSVQFDIKYNAAELTPVPDPGNPGFILTQPGSGITASSGTFEVYAAKLPGQDTVRVTIFTTASGATLIGAGTLTNVMMHVEALTGNDDVDLDLDGVLVNGDPLFGGACTSPPVDGVLEVVITTTATTVSSAPNPSVYGDAVPFTASVVSVPPGVPVNSGSVDFEIDGVLYPACSGANAIPVNGSGQAVCTTPALPGSALAGGAHTVRAYYLGNLDFTASNSGDSPYYSHQVDPANQTITFGPLGDKVYGDADFTVSATASSGLAVTFASFPDNTVCSVTGNSVHINAIGTCTIRASQGGNGNYNAALPVDQAFTVTPAPLTITADDRTKTYGAALVLGTTDFSIVGPTQLFNGDTITGVSLASAGAAATASVGSYDIVPSAAVFGVGSASNYTITYLSTVAGGGGELVVDPAPLTIKANDRTKTYGSTLAMGTTLFSVVSPTQLFNGDTISAVTLTSAGSVAAAAVGDYDIDVSGAVFSLGSASNYTISHLTTIGTGGGKLTVGAADLTIRADDRTKVYGLTLGLGTTQFSIVSPTQLLNGDAISDVTLTSAGTVNTASIGDYDIVPSSAVFSAGTASNYNITYLTTIGTGGGKLTVTKAFITKTGGSGYAVYDGVTHSPSPCVVSVQTGANIDGLTCTNDPSSVGPAPNVYVINSILVGPNQSNYDVSSTAGSFEIESGTVSGNVMYGVDPKQVPGVTLSAVGTPPTSTTTVFPVPVSTPQYTLVNFGAGSYTVTPSKQRQVCGSLNGVFINDATEVAKHVVGAVTLSGPALTAARVTGSPIPTAQDAALIAQSVVGNCSNSFNNAGKWRFNASSLNGTVGTALPATDMIQNITYNSLIGFDYTDENYTAIMVGDVTAPYWSNAISATARPAIGEDAPRATVGTINALPGSSVVVPFRIDNLKGANVESYQFDIVYDPAVVTPDAVAADLTGTLGVNLLAVYNVVEPGLLKVGVYGALPANGDGVYVNLKFSVNGAMGTSSPLSIQEFMFNDASVTARTFDGGINVSSSSGVAISGRVLAPGGESGLRNARVTLTSDSGETVFATTGTFGYFQFGELTVGRTYVVSVQSRRFRFAPVNVVLNDNVANLELIAQE